MEKILVDSNEPEELIRMLIEEDLDVEVRQLRFWHCEQCLEWFPDDEKFPKCPECDTEPTSDTPRERIADITNESYSFGRERKSESDFWSSLVDKRLFDQSYKIRVAFGMNGGILIDGDIEMVIYDHPDNENWIRSTIAEIKCVYGIHFDSTPDIAKEIKWLNRKSGKPIKHYPATKRMTFDERLLALMSCKGVGYEKALTLAYVFGDLNAISSAGDSIKTLKGFGDKTVANIMEFFHGKIQVPGDWKPRSDIF